MRLRPFSDHSQGIFVSVDGPSGAGKSTIVRHLAQMLVATGEDVHVTAEPSDGPIGKLCRELTETVTGLPLACLYAADRYHHVETEIKPLMETGQTVISDRYIPSGLVMQRLDGVDPTFLWQLNAEARRPDLAVILEANPEVIAERLTERGPHNRFQLTPGSSHAEVDFYRQATDLLIQAGFDVLRVDCNERPAEQVAAIIHNRLAMAGNNHPRDSSSLTLTAAPIAVGCSRRFAGHYLKRWGAAHIVDDAELVISELVTNAVKSTGITNSLLRWHELPDLAVIRVRVLRFGTHIIIAVWDRDETPPTPKVAAPDDVAGRGLSIVSALCARWNFFRPHNGGKVVWCELAIPPEVKQDRALLRASHLPLLSLEALLDDLGK